MMMTIEISRLPMSGSLAASGAADQRALQQSTLSAATSLGRQRRCNRRHAPGLMPTTRWNVRVK